jgi:ABC-2 type transport system ATP-binding protein
VFEQSLEVRQRIGYLPEDTPIYRDMTVLEYLEFAAEMRGMNPGTSGGRIKEIGGRCGLGDVAGKLVGELSKGYRQRVGLAQAMIHDPDILLLDEPTSGLDPNQIVEIRSLIKEIGREKTVILSTHILPEVQATCSRILIISGGKLVADGTPEALRAREKGGRFRVVVEANGVSREAVRDRLGSLTGVARCESVSTEAGAHAFALDGTASEDLRKIIFRAAVDNKWPLLELARESASLEDVFRNLTTGEDVKS